MSAVAVVDHGEARDAGIEARADGEHHRRCVETVDEVRHDGGTLTTPVDGVVLLGRSELHDGTAEARLDAVALAPPVFLTDDEAGRRRPAQRFAGLRGHPGDRLKPLHGLPSRHHNYPYGAPHDPRQEPL